MATATEVEEEEEEEEEERKEKEQKEALLRERAADLIKLTGNLKLAKDLKEADDKLKATRREAEEEMEKARKEEERLAKEAEEKDAEEERKREMEEEELREILKQILEMEKKENERKEMAKRKNEMMKKKREEKGKASAKDVIKPAKKKNPPKKEPRAAAQGLREEEEEEEEEWKPVRTKKGKKSKKRRARERAASSSSEESTESEPEHDSSDEEVEKQKLMKQVKLEQLARSRMVEARPKNDEERFGDNGLVTYQSFKNRFNAVAKVEGINPLDVLNEIGNWLTGTPKRMADAFKGAKNPKQAVRDIWEQLDRYYTIRSLTAHERIQPILKKGNITKDDIDAHIELVADLANIKTEAKIAKMEKQLDRVDIVRDLVNGKLNYLSEEFYIEEAKEKRENSTFRYKFQDVIDVASEKAQILKARGITSKKTAKVAATQAKINCQDTYIS